MTCAMYDLELLQELLVIISKLQTTIFMFKYYYFLQISTHVLERDMVSNGGVIEGSFEELCEKFMVVLRTKNY